MKKYSKISLIIVSILASLTTAPVFASVGKVIFAFGTVSVERPDPSDLSQGMPVEEGDVIVTGSNGYVQLKLDDNTKIAIRPNSRFSVLALEMPAGGGEPAIGAGVTPRSEFSLQAGGFRTSSGRIADTEPRAYQVSTPNAVVGIRGTNYVARLCAGDCGPSQDGLYVGVSIGSVFLANNGGELDLFRHQYGYAANFNTPPVRLVQPPASLQDEGLDALVDEEEEEEESDAEEVAEEFGSEGEESEESGDTSTETAAAPPSDGEVDQGIASADGNDLTGGGSATSNSFTFSTPDFTLATTVGGIQEETEGGITSFRSLGSAGSIEAYDIGTATLSNQGFDPVTGLKWGRWSGGTATVDGQPVDLSNSSLHFVSAPDSAGADLVITGSAHYNLVGNTDPTDNKGNIGIMGDASLFADFTNMQVTSDLLLSIDNLVWEASGTGDLTGALFSGLYETVLINGSPGGSGAFGGVFTGFDEGLPLGAGMNYNLTDGDSIVNGAVIFNRAQ